MSAEEPRNEPKPAAPGRPFGQIQLIPKLPEPSELARALRDIREFVAAVNEAATEVQIAVSIDLVAGVQEGEA